MRNGTTNSREVPAAVSQYTLKRIDGVALDAYWQWIREKLLLMQKKCAVASGKRGLKGNPEGIPEQVRMMILLGLQGKNTIEAYFVLDGAGAVRGFFTVSSPFHEFFSVPLSLYVWHAWGEPGAMAAIEPAVEKMARDRGMLAVEHESPRLEWIARHRKNVDGYKLARITWRKELV